jgi:hypothetical protein
MAKVARGVAVNPALTAHTHSVTWMVILSLLLLGHVLLLAHQDLLRLHLAGHCAAQAAACENISSDTLSYLIP